MFGKPVDLTGVDLDALDPDWLRLREAANRTDLYAFAVNPRVMVNIIDAAIDGMRFCAPNRKSKGEQRP